MPIGQYKNFAACVAANSDKKDPKAYCAAIENAVKAKEATLPNLVTEIFDVSEAIFEKDKDTGKMTAKVTILKAGRAKNPRNYRSSAVSKAAKEGVYDGLRMYVNHSDKPPTKRSMNELVSAVESTEYDSKNDRIIGNVEFFSPEFYDYAQRAKKHIGVSADHRIKVQKVREASGQMIDDVLEIVGAHSVDWVIYPSAGGEVISFAKESEGADEVEWDQVTLDQLKANAPAVLDAYKAELVKEAEKPPKDDKKVDDKEEPAALTADSIAKLVKEAIDEDRKAHETESSQRAMATKKVRDYVGKAGLPARTRDRIISQYSDVLEYVESDVKESVEDAKAELKEAGAGPSITGQGPSGGSSSEKPKIASARESVEALFLGAKKEPEKATSGAAASGKES